MRAGFVNSCAIGLAIALMLGAAPTARGQQDSTRRRPRSTQRIPITKDRPATRAPAPPAPAPAPAPQRERVNQDSINAAVSERARQDSIAAADRARQDDRTRSEQMRRDSITLADRERQDSIAEAEQRKQDDIAHRQSRARSDDELRRKRRYNSGFYMAIAGGSTMPMGELKTRTNNSYNMGWNVTVPFGVDFSGFPLGLRFDAAMDNLTGKPNFVDSFGTPVAAKNVVIYSGSGGLKLNIPIFRTASRIYAIGGASAHRITGYATSLVGSDSAQTVKDAKTNMGWYGGGGINFRFGRTALFVEARYINIEAKQPVGFAYQKANYIPVILGIQF